MPAKPFRDNDVRKRFDYRRGLVSFLIAALAACGGTEAGNADAGGDSARMIDAAAVDAVVLDAGGDGALVDAGDGGAAGLLVGDWEAFDDDDGVVDLTMHFSADGTYTEGFPDENTTVSGTYSVMDGLLSLDGTSDQGKRLTFDGPAYVTADHFTFFGYYPSGDHHGFTGVWTADFSSSTARDGEPPTITDLNEVLTISPDGTLQQTRTENGQTETHDGKWSEITLGTGEPGYEIEIQVADVVDSFSYQLVDDAIIAPAEAVLFRATP